MTRTMPILSVVIPSYQEEKNLKIILPGLLSVLDKIEPSYEVLIIDTMEPMDETKSFCASLDSRFRYLNRKKGNSFGDGVRTGITEAQGKYLIFMDADGSHDPEFISELYRYKDEFDVVIASRYIAGGATKNSKTLILMSRIVNLIYSFVLNLNCYDVSNSFKLYKTGDLKKLKLLCNNFDIVEEILFKLKRDNKNLTIKELPFTFDKRMFGKTKRNLFIFMLTYIYTLIKLRLGK